MIHLIQICKGIGQNLYMALFPVFDPAACALPDLPRKHIPTATPPVTQSRTRRLDPVRQYWELDNRVIRNESLFNEVEAGYLVEAGLNNIRLNEVVKTARSAGKTAVEALTTVKVEMPDQKVSLSYIQKIYAALSRADRALAEIKENESAN